MVWVSAIRPSNQVWVSAFLPSNQVWGSAILPSNEASASCFSAFRNNRGCSTAHGTSLTQLPTLVYSLGWTAVMLGGKSHHAMRRLHYAVEPTQMYASPRELSKRRKDPGQDGTQRNNGARQYTIGRKVGRHTAH